MIASVRLLVQLEHEVEISQLAKLQLDCVSTIYDTRSTSGTRFALAEPPFYTHIEQRSAFPVCHYFLQSAQLFFHMGN